MMFGLFKKKPKTLLDQFIVAAYGDRPPKARRADLGMAVEKSEIAGIAKGLFDGEIPYSTHDLAIATALNFFKRPELREDLQTAQLMARLTALEWLQEGKVVPLLMKSFEDTLYKAFK
jgi:tRNA isopentenyl-2-thiomethyl-A-37 hydroxylase MiaE